MRFMLGSIGLENPLDRRYFYAKNSDDQMLGFVVFLPYLNGSSYLAEVTRRKSDAPQGVMEKIIYEAFQIMKEEGVQFVNMGLSPLYNIDSESGFNEKLFAYIYDNMNEAFDFKALHHAKEKYAPTDWESRYLAYYPKPFSLHYAHAIIKAQNPGKLSKVILNQLKSENEKKDHQEIKN